MNKKEAFELFWTGDYAKAPSTSTTKNDNPTWQPISLLVGLYEQVAALRAEVAALSKKVK